MAINSKTKGASGERELAKILKERGYGDCRRTAQYCGNTGDASDVVGLDYIHCEVKRVEKLVLEKAMQQAIHDSNANRKGKFPTVFHRKNRGKWQVTMLFDDWIQLYDSYYSDMKLKEREDNE